MNGYSLSREWFNFSFENPEKIKPNHAALYFFAIEHCNRLGWKEKFGLPTTMAMEAIGIKSYNTYINTLNELIEFGFLIMVEKSKNQYSSNIIALSNFNKALDKAHDKALDKALIKHATKQSEYNKTIEPLTNEPITIQKAINKEFQADANKDLEAYQTYIHETLKGKQISIDTLLKNTGIYPEWKEELYTAFLKNAIEEVPQITDEKHAYNTFKLFVRNNANNYNKPKSKIKDNWW